MKKIIGLIALMCLLSSCGFKVVDDGFVGVKQIMGKIEKEEYLPGFHMYNPITTSMFEMSVRERHWENKLLAYSFDNQVIEVAFKVNYRPIASEMAELYTDKGSEYINVILPQRVETPTKEVLGKYKATNLVQVRSQASLEIQELISKRLEGTSIQLESFEITNFDYDDDFEEAVKRKVVAKERAVEEQNKTAQIGEQAKQKVMTAKADAQAIEVMARALSKNKDLIQLEAVKKWNGILPQYSMGGAVPFMNLKMK